MNLGCVDDSVVSCTANWLFLISNGVEEEEQGEEEEEEEEEEQEEEEQEEQEQETLSSKE